jgi:hypothetical protein
MPWEYRPIPEALLLPACQHCHNRSQVTMILRGVFFCADCRRPFVAVWVAERPALVEAGEERTA